MEETFSAPRPDTIVSRRPPLTARDLVFAAANGAIFGLLLPIVLKNLSLGIEISNIVYVLFFSIFAVIGILIGYVLSAFARFFFQLAKFGAVGATNTAIDFGIFNLFILLTGITGGWFFVAFKTISFVIAVTNSYLWNKFWSFGKKSTDHIEKEFIQFLMISAIGILLNVAIASFVNNIIGPLAGATPERWANVAAAIASILVLGWNFFGYKFIVFKK